MRSFRHLIPLFLFGVAFLLHLYRLLESPFLNGWDGYFYLVQLKAWIEEGAMHSPDSSPIYLLLRAAYAFCEDYHLAYKGVSALLAGGFTVLSYLLVRDLSRRPYLGLLAAMWTLFSPGMVFFTANFPKNLLGMDALLAFLWLTQRKSHWKWLALVLSALSHRLSAGLAILFWLAHNLRKRWVLLGLGMLPLLFGVALLWPGLLHWSDFERFQGAFAAPLQLPHLAFQQLLDLHGVWALEIWLDLVVLGISLWASIRKWGIFGEEKRFFRALLGLFLFLLLPFWGMEAMGIGYRFFLAASLLVPILAAVLLDGLGVLGKGLAGLVLICGVLWTASDFDLAPFDPDYAVYAEMSDRIAVQMEDEAPELLIGHKTLAEMITFRTGIDVLPWQPEYEVPADRLWRLSWGVLGYDYRSYLTAEEFAELRRISPTYYLLPEHLWQALRVRAEAADDDELLVRMNDPLNPHEERPRFLLRNKNK